MHVSRAVITAFQNRLNIKTLIIIYYFYNLILIKHNQYFFKETFTYNYYYLTKSYRYF